VFFSISLFIAVLSEFVTAVKPLTTVNEISVFLVTGGEATISDGVG